MRSRENRVEKVSLVRSERPGERPSPTTGKWVAAGEPRPHRARRRAGRRRIQSRRCSTATSPASRPRSPRSSSSAGITFDRARIGVLLARRHPAGRRPRAPRRRPPGHAGPRRHRARPAGEPTDASLLAALRAARRRRVGSRLHSCAWSRSTSGTTSASPPSCSSRARYGYFAGGANDELTLADNVAAYRRWHLRPRVLVDVADPSTATTVLGQEIALPVLVAPVAFQRVAHPDGEVAHGPRGRRGRHDHVPLDASRPRPGTRSPRPARRAGSSSTCRATTGSRRDDRGGSRASAGFEALVLTVDTPVLGRRERDLRTGFTIPHELGHRRRRAARGLTPRQRLRPDVAVGHVARRRAASARSPGCRSS